jgi:hypothetical protein
METRITNPQYSGWTPDGKRKPGNRDGLKDVDGLDGFSYMVLWSALIADPSQPESEKERAATCLRLFLAYAARSEAWHRQYQAGRGLPANAEDDHSHGLVMASISFIPEHWESPDEYPLELVICKDGVERTEVVRVKEVEAPEPTPGPMPTCGSAPSPARFRC